LILFIRNELKIIVQLYISTFKLMKVGKEMVAHHLLANYDLTIFIMCISFKVYLNFSAIIFIKLIMMNICFIFFLWWVLGLLSKEEGNQQINNEYNLFNGY